MQIGRFCFRSIKDKIGLISQHCNCMTKINSSHNLNESHYLPQKVLMRITE